MIRPEQPGDADAIHSVVSDAFASDEVGWLVRRLRASASFRPGLSLVAEGQNQLVGHVMATDATLDDGETVRRVLNLSPLATACKHQRGGIGSALVRVVVARAEAQGEAMMVLEGDPAFYGRFGFEAARPRGVCIELPEWAPPDAAQVLRLFGWVPALRGQVIYPAPFDDLTPH